MELFREITPGEFSDFILSHEFICPSEDDVIDIRNILKPYAETIGHRYDEDDGTTGYDYVLNGVAMAVTTFYLKATPYDGYFIPGSIHTTPVIKRKFPHIEICRIGMIKILEFQDDWWLISEGLTYRRPYNGGVAFYIADTFDGIKEYINDYIKNKLKI